MIINGNCRSDGVQAGLYITSVGNNEQVQVLEQWADYGHDPESNVRMAVMDFDLWSKSTLGELGLYHAQINPHPDFDRMTPELWKHCADHLEKKLGLDGQPRVMTLHTKNGRTHAHVIWARADVENNRLINIPYSRLKQKEAGKELSEELYPQIEINRWPSKGKSYDRNEQQQHERRSLSVQERREAIAEDWQQSRSGETFIKRLEARGYILARGDRRGFVLVDRDGDVYNPVKDLTKTLGVKTKEFRERIGVEPETLPTVEEAKARQKADREKMEARHLREADYWLDQQDGYYRNKIKDLKERHKEERLEKAGEIKAYYERNRPEAVRKAFQNLHEYDSNRRGYQEARIAADKKGELERRVKGFRGGARKITANFEEIYRDPPKAREKFKSFFEERGANKAARELDARPETFGKLRGNQFTETKAGQFLRKKLSMTGETERNQAIEQARKASRNLDRMIKSIGRAKWEAERLGGEIDRFMKTERIERAALLVDLAISAKGLTREEWKTLDEWQKQQVKAARENMKSLEPEDWRAINKHRKNPKGLSPVERRQKEELQEIKARRDEERRQIREREDKDAKRQAQKERAEARKKLTRTLAKEQEQSKGRGRSRERSRGEG